VLATEPAPHLICLRVRTLSKPQLVFCLLSCHLWVFWAGKSTIKMPFMLFINSSFAYVFLYFIRLLRCQRNLINRSHFWLACPQISHYFLAVMSFFCTITILAKWHWRRQSQLSTGCPFAGDCFQSLLILDSVRFSARLSVSFWNWSVCALWQVVQWERGTPRAVHIENLGKFG